MGEDRVRLRIEANRPEGYRAHVEVDGKPLGNVTNVTVSIPADGLVTAQLECLNLDVRIDGEFQREIHTFTAVKDGAPCS